jgi:hypothetical protein
VSKAQEKLAHDEVVIAADPTHEGRLLAGSMVLDGTIQTSAYMSMDGGKTWRLVINNQARGKRSGTDPAVAYGPDGAAYFADLPENDSRTNKLVELTASRNEGRSWSAPLVALPRSKYAGMDRPFLAVDCTKGKYHGCIYCCFLNGDLTVYRSRDGAKTFEAPKILMCKGATDYQIGKAWGQGVVLSDGAIVFPYCVNTKASIGQMSLRVRRSTPGGESFHDEQFLHDYRIEQKVFESSWGFPMMAVDPGSKAFKDRLYLAWAEVTRAGTSVMVTISKDRGVSWSPPMVISDPSDSKKNAESSGYTLLPTIAVNGSGTVAVTWYDTHFTGQDKFRCDLRLRASVDGGATWLPSVAVTDVASTYDKGSPGSRLGWLGDTAGLAADSAGAFHPLWIDNRTGIKQVFTASVTVH